MRRAIASSSRIVMVNAIRERPGSPGGSLLDVPVEADARKNEPT
jgi:hypothetical protein